MAIFTNQARLSYNNFVASSNVTIGILNGVLTVNKNAVAPNYNVDDDVTYVLSLTNSGTTALNNLTVEDNMGGYTPAGGADTVYPLNYRAGTLRYYVNGVLQPAGNTPTATGTAPVTFTRVNIPAGANAMLVYEADPTRFAPRTVGASINNTATASGAGITPVTAASTIPVLAAPALSISKSLSPTTVTENSQITYTFLIQNTGNTATTAEDNVVFSDDFAPVLNNLTATLDGTPLVENTDYTYNVTTGPDGQNVRRFTSINNSITVPAATFTPNPDGTTTVVPGTRTLVITGTV